MNDDLDRIYLRDHMRIFNFEPAKCHSLYVFKSDVSLHPWIDMLALRK